MKNISGTIATGGVAQTLYDNQNMPYKGFFVRNYSNLAAIWINENGTASAAQPSIRLDPLELYESPYSATGHNAVLSIYSDTSAVQFVARVW